MSAEREPFKPATPTELLYKRKEIIEQYLDSGWDEQFKWEGTVYNIVGARKILHLAKAHNKRMYIEPEFGEIMKSNITFLNVTILWTKGDTVELLTESPIVLTRPLELSIEKNSLDLRIYDHGFKSIDYDQTKYILHRLSPLKYHPLEEPLRSTQ